MFRRARVGRAGRRWSAGRHAWSTRRTAGRSRRRGDDPAARPGAHGRRAGAGARQGLDGEVEPGDPAPEQRAQGRVVDGDGVGPCGRGERAQHLARRARPRTRVPARCHRRRAVTPRPRSDSPVRVIVARTDARAPRRTSTRNTSTSPGEARTSCAGRSGVSGVAVPGDAPASPSCAAAGVADERHGDGEHREPAMLSLGRHDEPPLGWLSRWRVATPSPHAGARRDEEPRGGLTRKTMEDDRAGLAAVARFVDLLRADHGDGARARRPRCAPTSSAPLTPGSADDRGDARRAAGAAARHRLPGEAACRCGSPARARRRRAWLASSRTELSSLRTCRLAAPAQPAGAERR